MFIFKHLAPKVVVRIPYYLDVRKSECLRLSVNVRIEPERLIAPGRDVRETDRNQKGSRNVLNFLRQIFLTLEWERDMFVYRNAETIIYLVSNV